MISKMERDATGKAARAFNDFWITGDEAQLKQALVENLPTAPTAAVRAGNDWFAAQQAPGGVRKGVEMIFLKMISEKFNAWRRHRDAVRELSQFSDNELCDIGIRRCDIEDIVRRTGPRKSDA